MTLHVGKHYKLGNHIGAGAFGEIYSATNILTGKQVAVKLEPLNAEHPQLAYEARVYERMDGKEGIPRVYYFGREGAYHILVMDLLGESLEDLFNVCRRRFSLQTTLVLAEKMLNVLERVHDEGFVHRDLKPDNFLIGGTSDPEGVYLVDFGLSKCFWNPDTNSHIPYRTGKHLTGTPRYASIKNHRGCEQSRRDDLEALGYILVYFLKGELPWQNIKGKSKRVRYNKMMESKRDALHRTSLSEGLPVEFETYFQYVGDLGFSDRPDYRYMRRLFQGLYNRCGYSESPRYDWDLLAVGETTSSPRRSSQQPAMTTERHRISESVPLVNVRQQPWATGMRSRPTTRGTETHANVVHAQAVGMGEYSPTYSPYQQ